MSLFVELIRISIGALGNLSYIPSAKEWRQMFEISKKQKTVGISFYGIQRLFNEFPETVANLPAELKISWMVIVVNIQKRNEMMEDYTYKTLHLFRENGFECQVLKGGGIAHLYEDDNVDKLKDFKSLSSLASLRHSSDIDIWVSGTREQLYWFSIKTFGKIKGVTYHHIHFPIYDNVEIEVHSWPSFLASPKRNHRLQKFCKKYKPKSACGDTPSLVFNRVYILLHCYVHFAHKGVNISQFIDYYYVLKASQKHEQGNIWKKESFRWIESLGMRKFAEGTMWLMKEIFGLDYKCLICEPKKEYGIFMLNELFKTDNNLNTKNNANCKIQQIALGRYLRNLKHDFDIMKVCPHEALWEPLWGIYQYIWCKYTKRKFNKHRYE